MSIFIDEPEKYRIKIHKGKIVMSEIGSRLDFALKILNVKNKDLVTKLNLSQSNASNIMKRDALSNTVAKIAEYYNINLNWLYNGKGEMFLDNCHSLQLPHAQNHKKAESDAGTAIEKLLSHYKASSYDELSSKIITPAGTISKWKQRNSINAIKKKCRELGIYEYIFDNIEAIDNRESINKEVLDIVEVAHAIYSKNASKEEDFINLIKNWVRDNV